MSNKVFGYWKGGFGDYWNLTSYLLRLSAENRVLRINDQLGHIRRLLPHFEAIGTLEFVDQLPDELFFSWSNRSDFKTLKEQGYQGDKPSKIQPWQVVFDHELVPTKIKSNGNRPLVTYQLKAGSRKKLKESSREENEKLLSYLRKHYRVREINKETADSDCIELLAASRFYVGIDTGPTHMALSVGTPVFLIQNKLSKDFLDQHYPNRCHTCCADVGNAIQRLEQLRS